MSRTTSEALGHDVVVRVPQFRICVRNGVRDSLRGGAQAGSRAFHRLSLAWRRSLGHAPFAGCRRTVDGVPRARDVLVRLDCHGCTWSAHGWPFCRVFPRAMDATVLVGVVVGSSGGCDDRVRLRHTALVSTLAGGVGRRRDCEDDRAEAAFRKLSYHQPEFHRSSIPIFYLKENPDNGESNSIRRTVMNQPSDRANIPQTADPLPSWNDGPAKRSIVEFVATVTKPGLPEFVPIAERITVFDNDGTLWPEQPIFFQALFAFDRMRQLAPQHPEWKTREPFASVLRGDEKSALAGGMHALVEMTMAAHAGTTTEEFATIVRDWIATARHPKTGKLYTEMVYQPMLELLAYLRANGFKTFIVSAGGIEFMRIFSERVYGVPPEQVIGSSIRTKFELRDGKPVLVRLPEINFIDDGEGKPVGIQMHIGRRPVAAFGNADGDLQMFQWTAAGSGRRFCLYVHHQDAQRDVAHCRNNASFDMHG